MGNCKKKLKKDFFEKFSENFQKKLKFFGDFFFEGKKICQERIGGYKWGNWTELGRFRMVLGSVGGWKVSKRPTRVCFESDFGPGCQYYRDPS